MITSQLKTMLAVVAATSMSLSAQAQLDSGKYQIDPMHSKVGFEIPHLVISTVEGKFKTFSGEILIAPDFKKSKVTAKVEIASIDTAVEKRDEHLRSADFFDANQYPQMIFQSEKITGNASQFKLTGDLTIKGVTRKVTFEGQFLGSVKDGYGQNKIAFSAKTKINRKDFGLNWNSVVEAGPVVGDTVTLDLKIQAAQVVEKK